jgi:hypothetical protein
MMMTRTRINAISRGPIPNISIYTLMKSSMLEVYFVHRFYHLWGGTLSGGIIISNRFLGCLRKAKPHCKNPYFKLEKAVLRIYIHAGKSSKQEYNFSGTSTWERTINQLN